MIQSRSAQRALLQRHVWSANAEIADPRVRRTRRALHRALGTLLERHDFNAISVQHIAEEAELNRATFYSHYPDKFALLEAMVEAEFKGMVEERGIVFDGCDSALNAIALGVCDFLASTPRVTSERQKQIEPQLESAVIGVVRRLLLRGFDRDPTGAPSSPELLAAAVSGAIFGAAKEWVLTADRVPSESIAQTIVSLVHPIFAAAGRLRLLKH